MNNECEQEILACLYHRVLALNQKVRVVEQELYPREPIYSFGYKRSLESTRELIRQSCNSPNFCFISFHHQRNVSTQRRCSNLSEVYDELSRSEYSPTIRLKLLSQLYEDLHDLPENDKDNSRQEIMEKIRKYEEITEAEDLWKLIFAGKKCFADLSRSSFIRLMNFAAALSSRDDRKHYISWYIQFVENHENEIPPHLPDSLIQKYFHHFHYTFDWAEELHNDAAKKHNDTLWDVKKCLSKWKSVPPDNVREYMKVKIINISSFSEARIDLQSCRLDDYDAEAFKLRLFEKGHSLDEYKESFTLLTRHYSYMKLMKVIDDICSNHISLDDLHKIEMDNLVFWLLTKLNDGNIIFFYNAFVTGRQEYVQHVTDGNKILGVYSKIQYTDENKELRYVFRLARMIQRLFWTSLKFHCQFNLPSSLIPSISKVRNIMVANEKIVPSTVPNMITQFGRYPNSISKENYEELINSFFEHKPLDLCHANLQPLEYWFFVNFYSDSRAVLLARFFEDNATMLMDFRTKLAHDKSYKPIGKKMMLPLLSSARPYAAKHDLNDCCLCSSIRLLQNIISKPDFDPLSLSRRNLYNFTARKFPVIRGLVRRVIQISTKYKLCAPSRKVHVSYVTPLLLNNSSPRMVVKGGETSCSDVTSETIASRNERILIFDVLHDIGLCKSVETDETSTTTAEDSMKKYERQSKNHATADNDEFFVFILSSLEPLVSNITVDSLSANKTKLYADSLVSDMNLEPFFESDISKDPKFTHSGNICPQISPFSRSCDSFLSRKRKIVSEDDKTLHIPSSTIDCDSVLSAAASKRHKIGKRPHGNSSIFHNRDSTSSNFSEQSVPPNNDGSLLVSPTGLRNSSVSPIYSSSSITATSSSTFNKPLNSVQSGKKQKFTTKTAIPDRIFSLSPISSMPSTATFALLPTPTSSMISSVTPSSISPPTEQMTTNPVAKFIYEYGHNKKDLKLISSEHSIAQNSTRRNYAPPVKRSPFDVNNTMNLDDRTDFDSRLARVADLLHSMDERYKNEDNIATSPGDNVPN